MIFSLSFSQAVCGGFGVTYTEWEGVYGLGKWEKKMQRQIEEEEGTERERGCIRP